MERDWILGLFLVGTALAAAVAGLALLSALTSRKKVPGLLISDGPGGTVFVFDGEVLIDASSAGRSFLASAPTRGSAWQRLMSFLAPRFPDLDQRLAKLPTEGRFVMNALHPNGNETPMTLLAEWRGGLARISLSDPDADGMLGMTDPLTFRAMEEELRLLRGTVANAPLPIWLENEGGEVIWANSCYLSLAKQLLGPEQDFIWPLPRLMKVKGNERQRMRAGASLWYEAHVHPADGGRMIYAHPINGLVEAEATLRDFTQTLTKTFAHLPIGLVIFDRLRHLVLFNPAIPDLTGLPVDFLTKQPTLFDFLDRMREGRMIPEPKDYIEWRQRIIDLEKAAASGLYLETWSLPGGQVYRVIARPHPDGALAMLFEDISTEISRTRRFRADLELGESVLNAVEEAVAVFSASGTLVLSNTAYSALWGHDPAALIANESNIAVLAEHWKSLTALSPIWAEAEDFVASLGKRSAWKGQTRLSDGRLLSCRFVPLEKGATLIAFRLAAGDEPLVLEPALRQSRIPA